MTGRRYRLVAMQIALPAAIVTAAFGSPHRPSTKPSLPSSATSYHQIMPIRRANGVVDEVASINNFAEAAVSPDGRTIAAIKTDWIRQGEPGESATSLWLLDTQTRETRQLLEPMHSDKPERDLQSFDNVRFSLDGGFVYVDADAWFKSTAIHQINVTTGAERFVIDGVNQGIIRNGPYRGYLLVARYELQPGVGPSMPVSVVRPDGNVALVVPDSGGDDWDLEAWLRQRGWTAW